MLPESLHHLYRFGLRRVSEQQGILDLKREGFFSMKRKR